MLICDCDRCCSACGHASDCAVYGPPLDLDEIIANAPPRSFLAWLTAEAGDR